MEEYLESEIDNSSDFLSSDLPELSSEEIGDIVPLGNLELTGLEVSNDSFLDPLGDVCSIMDPLGNMGLINENDMGPITDYRQLLNVVNWNQREEEQWYILLLFNPINRTPAVSSFLENYQYLHERTGNVHYFIPGLQNDAQLKGDIYDSNWNRFQLSEKMPLWMLFDRKGMLETVNWLEDNCPSYEYREGIDLILMKSYGTQGNANLDVRNIISIPLEEVHYRGANIIDAITYVRKIVRQNSSFREAQDEIQSYLERNTGIRQTKLLKVFIAGSKDLSNERNAIRSQLQQISNRTKLAFTSYTYEDFPRDFIEDGQQAAYNRFIANQADFAVFIIDGKIGGITFDEFNVAMTAFKESGKPRIFMYCKDIDTAFNENRKPSILKWFKSGKDTDAANPEIRHIINEINMNHQYYCEYKSIYDLESSIHRDFMDIVLEIQ